MIFRLLLIMVLPLFALLGCEDSAKQSDPVGGLDPNDPITQVTLVPIPASTTIFVGSEVAFSWYATTQSGNRITDIPAELTISPQVIPADPTSRTYRFTEVNQYTATVRLNPPYDQFSDDLILTVTDQAPLITFEYPARGETVLATSNSITLRGRAEHTGRLTINGQEVTLATDGAFSHPFQPSWGLNQLNVEAEGAGVSSKITPTFSYADAYESTLSDQGKGVQLTDALMMAIAAAFFDDGVHDRRDIDDLATVLEVIIEDSDLATALGSTDAIESLRTRQDIGEFLGAQTTLDVRTSIVSPTAVGPTQVILDPVNGGIAFQARIGNDSKPALTIRLKVDLTFEFVSSDGRTGQATGSIYPTIRVGSALLSGIFFINKEPGMMPTASLSDFTLDINNVETDPIEDVELTLDFLGTTSTIDLSGIISLDSFTMNYIDPVINRAVDFITDSLESIVATASQTLLLDLFESLTVEDTLTFDNVFDPTRPSISLSYKTELNRFNFIDSGALVGLNLDVYTPPAIPRDNLGAIRRNGCLANRPNQFTPDWQNDVAFALQGDAINGLLYGIWQSGLITGPINLTEVLGDNSFLTGDDFNIVLDPYAPPILSACRDEEGATLRIGDLKMELAGELINIQLDSTVFVDIDVRAIYRTDVDGIFVEIGEVQTFDVEIVEVGEAADEERLRPFLEEQLGIIINGLLVGQGIGPLPLPSIDFTEFIDNLNAEDTLDIVPTGINSRDGHILVEANLD